MAFALTVLLLGCWLAGQSGVSRQPSYPKPNISLRPSGQVTPGGAVTIQCECRCRGARVLLSKAGDPDARRSMDPVGDVAEFSIRNVSQRDAGNYSCQYRTEWDPPIWSEPSDPVELVIAGGTNPTQLGTTPAPTHAGSAGPDGIDPAGTKQRDPPMVKPEGEGGTDPTQPGSPPPPTHPGSAGPGGSELKLSIPIIAGVSASAAGLLLLLVLVAFLCYRRKGPAPRQSRESEAAATVYALVGEGKQLDGLPQEPDPGADGLTYAELDAQVLQAKRGGPARQEPVLYATINVSRGAPQGGTLPPPP